MALLVSSNHLFIEYPLSPQHCRGSPPPPAFRVLRWPLWVLGLPGGIVGLVLNMCVICRIPESKQVSVVAGTAPDIEWVSSE